MRVALGVAFLLTTSVAGAESRPALIVQDLEAKGATPLQAEAATQGLVRGLRELDVFQVLSTTDVRQLLAIERSRQMQGSAEAGGVTDLAKMIGAYHVVVGSVTRVGAQLTVELRLLDTSKGVVLNQKNVGPVGKIEQLANTLPTVAQELVGPLLQEQQGTLVVQSREEASEVLVDDILVGSIPLRTPLKLPRGSHRLQVRKDGFIAQSRVARINPDQVTVEEFTLVPSADYVEAYKLRHGRLRVGAYITTAVAALAVGGAIYVSQAITQPTYQTQFLPRQLALQGKVESELPVSIRSSPSALALYNACGASQVQCARDISPIQSEILTAEIATIGLIAIATASAGIATYLWLTGQDPNRYSGLVAGLSLGASPMFVLGGHF